MAASGATHLVWQQARSDATRVDLRGEVLGARALGQVLPERRQPRFEHGHPLRPGIRVRRVLQDDPAPVPPPVPARPAGGAAELLHEASHELVVTSTGILLGPDRDRRVWSEERPPSKYAIG